MKKKLISESMLNHHINRVVSKHLKESYEESSQKDTAIKLMDNAEKNIQMIRKFLSHKDADIVLGEHEEMFYKFQELQAMANDLRQLVVSELDVSGLNYDYDPENFKGPVKASKRSFNMNEGKK